MFLSLGSDLVHWQEGVSVLVLRRSRFPHLSARSPNVLPIDLYHCVHCLFNNEWIYPTRANALRSHVSHLELGRQSKVSTFYTFWVERWVRFFETKNLYRNDT
jgi:hypothetical protein